VKNEERGIQLSRQVELVVGIVASIVSLLLIILCLLLLTYIVTPSWTDLRQGVTLFAIPASFALFFSFVSINFFKRKINSQNSELMSLNGWLFLAGTLFGLALIVLFLGNWIGAVLPVVIGAFSLFKEPRIRKLYQVLFNV